MYIEEAHKGLSDIWRYIIGLVIIFVGWQIIGMLPLLGMLFYKVFKEGSGSISVVQDITGMSQLLGSNLFLFLMLFSFAFGLMATFITSKYVHQQSIVSLTTSRKKIDWKRIFFSFFLWAIITVIMVVIDIYLSPENYEFNFKMKPFLVLTVIAVLLVPLQTSFEEYFMRGYLMQGIGVLAKNRFIPLIITSLIFGLLHLFNPEVEKLGDGIMVYYIGTGLFLGILTLMDEGLELALGFHAANNLITALLVTADWTAFQTESLYIDVSEPVLGWDVFIPVLVIYPTLLFIFSKKYGWTNWKERLTGKVLSKEEFVAIASANAESVS